jgi:hypothetical protein
MQLTDSFAIFYLYFGPVVSCQFKSNAEMPDVCLQFAWAQKSHSLQSHVDADSGQQYNNTFTKEQGRNLALLL